MSCKGVSIHIDDNEERSFVSESEVRQSLRTAKLKLVGTDFDSINTLEITRLLEKNKLVRKAHCYHTPDSCLRIDVEQRTPILRIKSISIGDCYIDDENMLMPVQSVVPMQIPLATGFISKEIAEKELFNIAEFLQDNRFWRQEITQIYVNTNGDIELIPRIGQHTILIGDSKNLETKMKHVKTFYEKVLSRKGWNFYKVINVKFENQVVGEKG